MRFHRLAAAATVALLAACSAGLPPVVAGDVRISRPGGDSAMAAGYLALTNNTRDPITITRVASPQFESVAMHETVIEDGVARMRALGELTLAPGETVRFEPGGKHLMLMRPRGAAGAVRLDFFAGDTLILSVGVE